MVRDRLLPHKFHITTEDITRRGSSKPIWAVIAKTATSSPVALTHWWEGELLIRLAEAGFCV